MITKVEVFGEHRASTLSLGGLMPSDDPVHIRNIDGLGPVKAEITTTPSGTSRGETKNGSSTGKRNIVMTLGFNPDWANQTISGLRKLLYGYFMTEQWVKLRFYSDDYPVVDIEGTVESCDPNQFSSDPEMQVSIINEKPDFVEIDATIYTGVVDTDGETWLEVDYEGSVYAGLELRIDRSVENPSYTGPITISVINFKGNKVLDVSAATIDTTKSLKISSVPGQKRVQNEALSDGEITNLLRNKSGDWPLLQPGENLINVRGVVGGQKWTLAFFNRFGGL